MRFPSPDPAIEREFRAWLHAAHSPAHSRRTAANNAAFFLPYLRPGMRLIDIGCGPGSITLGLAEAVAPGEAIGVDASPRAIEAAATGASAGASANVRFEVASLYRLPFEPTSFDAVFMHALLQHLPDPEGAVAIAARLLRPGGVIGVADADYDGSIIWPAPRPLRRAVRLMERVRRYSGGDIHVGKKLGSLLAKAGLQDIRCGVSGACEGDAEATRLTGAFWATYYASPDLRRFVPAVGIASEGELGEASQAWRDWGDTPGAMWARFWCQAVARKPSG